MKRWTLGRRHATLALLAGVLVLGKVSGFLRDVLLTYFFGISDLTDAYFLAATLSSLLYIGLYGSIPLTLVPAFTRVHLGEDPQGHHATAARAGLGFFIGTSLLLAAVCALAAPALVALFASARQGGHDTAQAALFLQVMVASFVFSTAVAAFVAQLSVEKRPIHAYAVPVATNGFFCLGIFLFGPAQNLLATLIVGQLGWVLLALLNHHHARAGLARVRQGASASWRHALPAFRSAAPAAAALYVEQGALLVCTALATQMPTGSVSIFNYASKLNLLFLSVFGVVLTSSLFPALAAAATHADRAPLRAMVLRWCRLSLLLAVPVVSFLALFAGPVVSLVFQRGNFAAHDAHEVARAFSWLALSLPFALGRDILNRVLFSLGRPGTSMLISAAAALLLLTLAQAGLVAHGVEGLAIAWVAATLVQFACTAWVVQRGLEMALLRGALAAGGTALLAALLAGLAAWALHRGLGWHWIATLPMFLLTNLALLQLLRNPEWLALRQRLARRFARPA